MIKNKNLTFISVAYGPKFVKHLKLFTNYYTMNKLHYVLITSLTFSIFSVPINAQTKVQNDPNYYETFPDKITGRVFLSQKYVHLNFPSGSSADDLEYKANPKLNLGIGVSFKNFSINLFNGFSFLNKKDEPKGKTKGLDLQVHLYPKKWAIDLLAVSPKGYHLEPKGVAGASSNNYYYRADLKSNLIGLSAYRVPNKEKFSYRAAIVQTEWQKKSAGSFLYGGEVYYGSIQGDSALIPALLSNTYPQAGIKKVNFFSVGPGVGYAHTLVIDQHFFITGSMIFNMDINFTKEEGVKKETKTSLNPAEVFKAAIGYNSNTWNVSANWTGNGVWVQGASIEKDYFLPSGNIRLVVAHRFNKHKHHS
jgi:hypothetical protein